MITTERCASQVNTQVDSVSGSIETSTLLQPMFVGSLSQRSDGDPPPACQF